jgi:diacylglycerol kinase
MSKTSTTPVTPPKKKHHFFKGFGYAGEGIARGFSTEFNLRFHMLAIVLVTLLGFVLGLATYEWLALVICFTIVPALEIVNSAIEETCDRLRDDLGLPFEATKWARDLAAGAVLWAAIGSAIVGLIIFVPKIIGLFG